MKAVRIALPFVHDAEIITTSGLRKTRRKLRFRDEVAVDVGAASRSEFNLVLVATNIRAGHDQDGIEGRSEDRIYERSGHLYRPLLSNGRILGSECFTQELGHQQHPDWTGQITGIPAPPSSVAGRFAARAAELTNTVEEEAHLGRWKVVATPWSNHADRWAEAYAHYTDAVLDVDGEIWVRCGAPAWFMTYNNRALYQRKPNPYYATLEFPIDDLAAMEAYASNFGRGRHDRIAVDAELSADAWATDSLDLFVALGHAALGEAQAMKAGTTRAQRRDAGCVDMMARLSTIYGQPGPLKVSAVASIIDDVAELATRLQPLMSGSAAHDVATKVRRLKIRLGFERAREVAMTADDEAVLDEIAGLPLF